MNAGQHTRTMAVNKTGWVEFVCKIILFSENNSLKVGKKVSKREKLYIFMLNLYFIANFADESTTKGVYIL
jgi:hypothetical protein